MLTKHASSQASINMSVTLDKWWDSGNHQDTNNWFRLTLKYCFNIL